MEEPKTKVCSKCGRELQQEMRELKSELIARGFQP